MFDELLARLRVFARRQGRQERLLVDDLVVDRDARAVTRDGVALELTAREFDLLALLAQHAGRVVSRYEIFDAVWDGETDLRSNAIDVHIANLRAKIDRPFGRDTLQTVRGVGFRLTPLSAMRRMPVRVRLVAGFVIAMIVVLLGAGAFVFWRVQYALDHRLDQDLAEQSSDLVQAARGQSPAAALASLRDEGRRAQLLSADGRVLASGTGDHRRRRR